jgi:hypothetical protein
VNMNNLRVFAWNSNQKPPVQEIAAEVLHIDNYGIKPHVQRVKIDNVDHVYAIAEWELSSEELQDA